MKRFPFPSVIALAVLLVPILAASGAFFRGGAIKMFVLELSYLVIATTLGVIFYLRQSD